jgi:hypothetical protein
MNKVEAKVTPEAVAARPTQVESAAPRSWGWPWDALALVVPLIATLPWIRLEWLALQARQERWFGAAVVGLVLLGSILTQLLRNRGADQSAAARVARDQLSRSRARAAVGLLLGSALAALLAALWLAPWLGAVAALGSLTAWALGRFPAIPGPKILAWAGVLLLVLPLPGRWDFELPAWLEQSAGALSGSFLDLIGVPNLQFGNSLEVRELSYTFPLAGRGPLAFWGLAGLIGATLLLRRPPLLLALVSLAFLPLLGWVLYLNRFVGLAYLQHAWGINALGGTSFIWFCLACLAVVYFGWLLLDLTLRYLLDAAPPEVPELAPFYARLNTLLCWPHEPPFDLPEEYLPPRQEVAPEPPGNWWRSTGLRVGVFAALGLSLFAGVVSLAVYGQSGLQSLGAATLADYTAEKLRDFPGREVLPETIDGWQRTEFAPPLDEQGELPAGRDRLEFRWTYLSGKRNLQFLLRLPFLGEPNPESLFEQQGWEVTEVRVQRDADGLETAWLELFLRNSSGGRAWVCVSSFDSVGRPYSEWSELARLLPNRPDALTTFKRLVGELPPRTMQLQLYCDAVDANDKPELARLRRIYLQLRQKALEHRTQRNWSLGS